MPKISIIMPVYNTQKYVSEAIESILNQTFEDFEFILIDDGSTDRSWEIIQKFAVKDSRIKAFRNEINKRLVFTRNIGLDHVNSNSTYVGICDADDYISSDRLEKTFAYMELHEDISAVGIDIRYVDASGLMGTSYTYPKAPEAKATMCFRSSPMSHGGSLIRIEDWKKIGFWYDENYLRAHDYELWSRFIGHGYKLAGLDDKNTKTYHRVFGGEQGKRKYLKLTIKNSLRIQKKMIYEYNMKPSMKERFYMSALHILLYLPGDITFRLFKKLRGVK